MSVALSVPGAEMARGLKKHLKRVATPKHWMLDKLTGVFAPRPSTSEGMSASDHFPKEQA